MSSSDGSTDSSVEYGAVSSSDGSKDSSVEDGASMDASSLVSGSEGGTGMDSSSSASDSRRHDPRNARPCSWVPEGWPALSRRGTWRILLPCAGADAVSRALRELNIKYTVVGAWELDANTGKLLTALFAKRSDRGNIHVGSMQGDMTHVKARDVPEAEGLVAGPPCPPWSQAGARRGWEDGRAKVSKVLFLWLRHLCQRKRCLRFFILENVRGILGKLGRGYLGQLRAAMPKDWNLAALRMDSRCLAQTRPRAYLVGWKASRALSSSEATRAIRAKLPQLPRRHLSDILLDLPNEDPKEVLTARQARNFRKWMRLLAPQLKDKRKRGMVGCFEADRDPDKSRANWRADDLMMTLRASGHPIWLVSLGEGHCGPSTSRLLAVEERCLLQGFDPSTFPESVSASRIRHAMGNAMTVPVIGSVLGATLRQLQEESELSAGHVSGGRQIAGQESSEDDDDDGDGEDDSGSSGDSGDSSEADAGSSSCEADARSSSG